MPFTGCPPLEDRSKQEGFGYDLEYLFTRLRHGMDNLLLSKSLQGLRQMLRQPCRIDSR